MKTIYLYVTLFIAVAVSCTTYNYVSTIESTKYDKNSDKTTYTVLPFGVVILPGKWNKTTFNNVSYQQNFKNVDSVSSAVCINQASNYPFYKPNMTSNQIVKEMYEWDAQYWAQRIGAKTPVLKSDTTNHFIIWQIKEEKYKVDNYYLFGCEKGIVFTVFINSQKWDSTEINSFLETVYRSKTVGSCCNQ